jgi:hypothetical protein
MSILIGLVFKYVCALLGDPSIPSCSSRIALTKLLIELSQLDKALDVLSSVEKDDDELVDLWYLFGWVNYLKAQQCTDNSEKKELLDDAKECLENTKKVPFVSSDGIK